MQLRIDPEKVAARMEEKAARLQKLARTPVPHPEGVYPTVRIEDAGALVTISPRALAWLARMLLEHVADRLPWWVRRGLAFVDLDRVVQEALETIIDRQTDD